MRNRLPFSQQRLRPVSSSLRLSALSAPRMPFQRPSSSPPSWYPCSSSPCLLNGKPRDPCPHIHDAVPDNTCYLARPWRIITPDSLERAYDSLLVDILDLLSHPGGDLRPEHPG